MLLHISLLQYQAAIIDAYHDGKQHVDMAAFSLFTNHLLNLNNDQFYNWFVHWNGIFDTNINGCIHSEVVDYCKAIKPFHSNNLHSSTPCLCQLKSNCDDLLWELLFDNQQTDLKLMSCTSDDTATVKGLNSDQQVLKGTCRVNYNDI